MYDFVGQNGLPPHMSQYGLASAASPRPGSGYGQPVYDDSYNIDGEIYDPDADPEYYIQDQNLIQEWPFGHKTGLEGKSTVTYSPQQQVRGLNPANAGMFASALRGPSIQYGVGYPSMAPPQPPAAQLPGPGFFSQNSQQPQVAAMASQAGMLPGAFGSVARPGMTPTGSPVTVPPVTVVTPKATTTVQSNVVKPTPPMMPPNAVIPTQSSESKPKLIPGSVGVPAASSTAGGTTVSKAAAPSVSTTASVTPSQPGSAASLLSTLASKHQQAAAKASSPSSTPAVTTQQKTVFQGFSFTSTPKITESKVDDKQNKGKMPETTSAPSQKPFSGFSFTTPTKPAATIVQTSTATGQGSQAQSGGTGFPFAQGSGPSFATLAAQGQTSTAFQAAVDQKGFAGTGTPLFGKSPSPRRRNTSAGSDDHVEEYEPNVDFKPVIQLPDLIEVRTGEEDEEQLFCERAKLFRFDTEANQWKERGIGEMKILKHKETKKVRILMRREQVLKLCANHIISADMKLTPMVSSDKAWVWNAMDFSEEEMKSEKLAVKFKNCDIAHKFKQVFEDSQAEMTTKKDDNNDKKKDDKTPEEIKDKPKETDSEKSGKCDLAELFKPKPGSWTCNGCFVNNAGDVLKCPCCQTLKPGVKPEDVKSETSSSFGAFSFGGKSSGQSSGFKIDSGSTAIGSAAQTGSGFQFGSAATSATGSGFTFGSSAATSTAPASGFMFGSPAAPSTASRVTFGGSPAVTAATTTSTSVSGFQFGSPAVTSTATSSQKPDTGATSASSGVFKFGAPATTTTAQSGFVFGGSTNSESKSSSTEASKEQLSTTSGASVFTFGSGDTTSTSSGGIFGANSSGGPFGTKTTAEASTSGTTSVAEETTTKSENKQNDESGKPGLGESLLARFLSSPDSWRCPECNEICDGFSEKCITCGTDRLKGSESTDGGTLAELLGTKTGDSSSNVQKGLVTTDVAGKPEAIADKPSSAPFSFGQTKSAEGSAGTGFDFALPKTSSEGFKFTFAPVSDTQKPQPAASLGSGFNFSLSMTPLKSPKKLDTVTSPKSPEVNEEGYYVNREGDDSHIHFEPVIALPDHVEVKTGEEDEEVVFSHRAKLYRFVSGEWKERGLGDVKVLYNSETNKARILMRREQILKPCCNHYITQELKLKPMPNSKGCALVWYAMDFADEEPRTEQFSIKFRNEEIAQKFEKAVEDTKMKLAGARPKTSQVSNIPTPAVETLGGEEKGEISVDVEITKVN